MQVFGPSAQDDDERALLLKSQGPRIDVILTNPIKARSLNELNSEYYSKTQEATALIDTGASVNCVDNLIARQLNLKVIDTRLMRSANTSGLTPIYLGQILIPKLNETILGEFYGADLSRSGQQHKSLLGTPFLSNFIFNYDGPKGLFHIGRTNDLSESVTFDE